MTRNDALPSAMPARSDRRRRHAHDPTISVNFTLPISLANAVDDVAIARRWTRNAVIRAALEHWLAAEAVPVDVPPS